MLSRQNKNWKPAWGHLFVPRPAFPYSKRVPLLGSPSMARIPAFQALPICSTLPRLVLRNPTKYKSCTHYIASRPHEAHPGTTCLRNSSYSGGGLGMSQSSATAGNCPTPQTSMVGGRAVWGYRCKDMTYCCYAPRNESRQPSLRCFHWTGHWTCGRFSRCSIKKLYRRVTPNNNHC